MGVQHTDRSRAKGCAMDYEGFLKIVEHAGRGGPGVAERAVQATLQTLAERLPKAEARNLAEELPPELGAWVHTGPRPERFGAEEFVRRVADRLGVDGPTAERYAAVVFAALAQAVSDKEYADLTAVLPNDFGALLPRGPDTGIVPAERFLARVAERAGLNPDAARRATDAVLEVLAERIAAGEVQDLVQRLDAPLCEPLRRGQASGPGTARRMSLEDFLDRIAQRPRDAGTCPAHRTGG